MKVFTRYLMPLVLGLIVVVVVFLGLRPAAITRQNSERISGVVNAVSKGGLKDIVITLAGIRGIHYISRGIERGINADSLSAKLLNKKVTVYYAKPGFFSRLSPVTDTRRITELRIGERVVFSEFH